MNPEPHFRPPEHRAQDPDRSSRRAGPVLCAVDASGEAPRVARCGAALAKRVGTQLVLIHIVRGPGWHPVDELAHADRHATSHDEAARLLEAHAADVDAVAAMELREGEPVDELLSAAVELDPLLLVMGARVHGLVDSILGCVARDVARWSPLPTLVIPATAPEDALERDRPLLCGFDDSPPAGRAVELAAELAGILGVPLVIMSVVDARPAAVPTAPAAMPVIAEPPELLERQREAARERTEQLAARFGALARTRAMVEIGDPAARIAQAGDDLDVALIVVGTRRRSRLAALVTGSVSRALMHGPRPLLIVP
jgi:nucleotide-binding universal stress UspA family protein